MLYYSPTPYLLSISPVKATAKMAAVFRPIATLLLLITFTWVVEARRLWSSSFAVPKNASFDYVIVGGGTAGNTIAARLAENSSFCRDRGGRRLLRGG